MCVVIVAPHLIGLFQLYSLSFKLHAEHRSSGLVDQVVTSALRTIRVLLEVIERVDAPFCENLIKIISRFLSDRPTQPSPNALTTSDALYDTLLFRIITEEMRSELCQIMRLVFVKLSSVSLASVLQPSQLSPLFFIVYQLLDISVHDKNRVNQRQALKSLKAIILALSPSPIPELILRIKKELDQGYTSKSSPSQPTTSSLNSKPSTNSTSTFDSFSSSSSTSTSSSSTLSSPPNVVASIVPGILTSCTRVLMGDFKQGDGVFCAALDLLAISIVSTMADVHNAHLAAIDETMNTSESTLSKLREMMAKSANERSLRSTKEMTQPSPSSSSSSSSHSNSASSSTNPTDKSVSSATSSKSSKSSSIPTTPSSSSQSSSNDPLIPGKVDRDPEWFKKASYHISLVLERTFSMSRIMAEDVNAVKSISAIVIRSGRVRLEMAKSSSLILSLCRRSLSPSFAILFELLVLFAFDEFDHVAFIASQTLQKLETNHLSRLLSTYTPHVHQLIQSIPRIMRSGDDHKKLLLLRLVTGWTRISDSISFSVLPALTEALSGVAHLLQTAPSLVFLNPQVSLLTDADTTQNSQDSSSNIDFASLALNHLRQTYHTQFAFFKDKRIYEALVTLLRHLGAQGRVEHYFDIFFALQVSNSESELMDNVEYTDISSWISDKAAHILVLNEVMMGASGFLDLASDRRTKLSREAKSKLKDQWEHYLSYLLGDDIWNQRRNENNATYRYRLILAMEGLGNMSMVFGKQFEKYFVLTLYRLLAMAGSKSEILNRVGKMTLVRFAHHTGYNTVVSMVENNLDYIVEEMIRELRYSEDVQTSLKVFAGILALRSALIVPLLDDIIDDIFKRLDFSEETNLEQLIGVLGLVIRVVSSHVPLSQKSRLTIQKQNRHVVDVIHRLQSAAEGAKFENFDFSTKSESGPLPSSISSQVATSDILEDFTMHSWIQRCELEYLGRADLQSPQLTSSENEQVKLGPSNVSNSSAEYDNRGENRMAHGQDAENEEDYFTRSRALHSQQFNKELAQSYIQEDESALKAKGGFGLSKWLRTRIERRKNEAAALESLHHPESSSFLESSSSNAESFFRDHHQKKEEKAARGDDLHEGSEAAARAGEDEDIDSDEEYKYPEDLINESGVQSKGESLDPAGGISVETHQKRQFGKFLKLAHRPGYDVVHAIVLRLVNWLSVPRVEVKCSVLNALSAGLSVLAEHRKILLPTLHTVWMALQWRFLDPDERVMRSTWELVRDVGRFARSFLAQKFCDLWPLLRDLIRSHNPFLPEGIRYISKANVTTQYSSVGSGSTNYDLFASSASYKVQSSLILTITFATQHLSLPAHTIMEMAREMWFYLAESQPLKLQSLAISFYQSILGLNSMSCDGSTRTDTPQLRGSDANGLFHLLAQLSAHPHPPPPSSISFLQSFPDDSMTNLPRLAPSQLGVLPPKYASHPDAFFDLFRRNVTSLLAPNSRPTVQ